MTLNDVTDDLSSGITVSYFFFLRNSNNLAKFFNFSDKTENFELNYRQESAASELEKVVASVKFQIR